MPNNPNGSALTARLAHSQEMPALVARAIVRNYPRSAAVAVYGAERVADVERMGTHSGGSNVYEDLLFGAL